jgi:AAA+ ATPase superfamily predicted ATPase
MRTSVQTFSILSLIGSGVHRPSEIAGRLGKPATQLSRLFGFLINQGYIRREVPFGESIKSSKKSLYKLDDPFLNFYFTFLVPNKSRLEFDMIDEVWQEIEAHYDHYISGLWEDLCRKAIPHIEIDGNKFSPASRWWGSGIDKKLIEIDIVAESTDKKTLLIGEVKWANNFSDRDLISSLDRKISGFPLAGEKAIIKALFLKNRPIEEVPGFHVFTPSDIVSF